MVVLAAVAQLATPLVLVSLPVAVLTIALPLMFVGCEFEHGSVSAGVPFDDFVNGIPSLVSFWHLNEPSGPTATDSKGGHDGTYNNAPVAADPPQKSAAAPGILEFDQPSLVSNEPAKRSINVNGGYVQVPFAPELHTPQFTIHAFVRTNWTDADTGVWRCVFSCESSVLTGFGLYANPDNRWEVDIADGSSQTLVAADGPISLGTTDFVAVTYDGTTLTLYVNAEVRATATLGYAPSTSPIPTMIGQGSPTHWPFVGQLEEIAYYNTALDQQTIYDIGRATV